MAGNYRLVSNLAAVQARLSRNADSAIKAAGKMGVDAICDTMLHGYHTPHGKPPHTEIYDTGALYESIDHGDPYKSDDNVVSIDVGTEGIPYAGYVHNGTSLVESRPYIRDGINDHLDDLQDAIVADLSVGFDT